MQRTRLAAASIEQVCNSLHPLSTVEDLYIKHQYLQLVWKDDAIENTLWLQLLLPFTAVKNLYLSKEFAPGTSKKRSDRRTIVLKYGYETRIGTMHTT
jgi:hypothetical protein